MLKLYHNDMSTCSQKVRFLLAVKGIEWEGVASWFNQKYLPLMDKAGTEAWPRVAEIRDQVRTGG